MSIVKTNNVQIGQSVTATNNGTWYQPATPDGTIRYGIGNSGATTSDVVTLSSSGLSATALIPSGSTAPTNGMFLPTTNTLAWSTNSTESLRLDSSGNLGLGVTPSAWNSGVKAIQILNTSLWSSGADLNTSANAYYGSAGWTYTTSAAASAYQQSAGAHYWLRAASGTAGSAISFTQAMTLDASGQLQLGTTVAAGGKFKVLAGTNIAFGVQASVSISGSVTLNAINENNTANVPLDLRCSQLYVTSGITAGAGTNALKYNTSNNAFTYDTSSARYKNNIRDSVYGLGDVLQLRSAMFEYKSDGRTDVGLIAEEVFDVIPELVPLDSEGRPDAVSYDRMVSVLVKAVQELSAELNELKQKVNA